jgi:hypothetical protein
MRSLVAATLSLSLAAPALAKSRVPTVAEIAVVERAVQLPAGARPLGDYVRHYTFRPARAHGRQPNVIAGIFVVPGLEMGKWNRRPGAYGAAILPTPHIADGGCAVVHVFYDPEARRMIGAFCNGDA